MTSKPIFAIFLAVVFTISSFSPAFSWIPPTNAFDHVNSDNGTVYAVNSSMPLNVNGGSGISVKSDNATHTLQISSTLSQASGTYNTTQANNVNINTGGSKINFINGTGATVHLQNSGSGNQVNVTISATGTAGVTSLNALTGALTIACVSGNTTCTTSGGNTITVNTAYNVVMTNGVAQTINKNIDIVSNTNFPLTVESNVVGAGVKINGNTIPKLLFFSNGNVSQIAEIPFYAKNSAGSDTRYSIIVPLITTNTAGSENGNIGFYTLVSGATTKMFQVDGASSGTLTSYVNELLQKKITQYNSINTAGWGVPAIYGSGRLTGLTGASGTVTSYTVGGSDGTFEVSGDILATTSTNYSFMYMVDWTDETGTARTTGMMFTGMGVSGVTATLSNSDGPDFQGLPLTIHAKAGTAITLHTNGGGTYMNVTYNIDGIIKQVS